MAKDTYYIGLDVGTSSIRTVIAVKRSEQPMPDIIGVGIQESQGIRKGSIVDNEEIVSSITGAIEAAEYMAGEPIDHAYVSIGGPTVKVTPAKGVVAVGGKNGEISHADVERVIDMAQNIPMQGNRQILRVIPHSFVLDDQQYIKDPVGMSGIRLEANTHVVSGSSNQIKNLTRCIHQTGTDIDDLVPSFLASSEATLTKRQKELGVLSLDLGGGSTTLSVWEEGALLHVVSLPVGAAHITNDLAIGLRTSIDVAEKIKVEFGSCSRADIKDKTIDISHLTGMDEQGISHSQIVQIIEARMYEILSLVYEELRQINRAGMLPAGVILTGGGAKLTGLVDFTKDVLGLPVQVGYPVEFGGLKDRVDDPGFATVCGLVLWAMKSGQAGVLSQISFGSAVESVKGFFRNLLP